MDFFVKKLRLILASTRDKMPINSHFQSIFILVNLNEKKAIIKLTNKDHGWIFNAMA